MWVILFTAKLLIINFTNSYIGQAFTEGCLKKIALTKGHFGHHVAKGQVLKHPPPPPLHVPARRLYRETNEGNDGDTAGATETMIK